MTSKIIILMFMLAIVIIAGFIFWIGGGFDKFRSPVEVVLPRGYSGIICARLVDVQQPESRLRYEANQDGLLFVGRDVILSHRRWKFYRRSGIANQLQVLSSDEWSSVFTENDASAGIAYTVFWIGTPAKWQEYVAQHAKESYCLDRF